MHIMHQNTDVLIKIITNKHTEVTMGNKQTKKEVNITEYIYAIAIFIMLFIMVLGPILWVLGYGGNK